jgi:hypothetical protein
MAYLSDYLGNGVGLSATPLGGIVSNIFMGGTNFVSTKQAVLRSAYPALTKAFPLSSEVNYESISQTMPSFGPWTSVCWGNGIYVAFGPVASSIVARSFDGVNWIQSVAFASTTDITASAFGNGVFVALDSSATNRCYTSPDGITWTARTLPSAINWTDVIYANNQFVAVSSGSSASTVAATSPDGITWTARTLPTSASWGSVAYGNGVYLAVSGWSGNATASAVAATSPDGITWTARTLPNSSFGTSVAFGNGVFVVVAGNGSGSVPYAATSPDGITWNVSTVFSSPAFDLIVSYGNGVFFVLPYNATAGTNGLSSFDGLNWTSRPIAGTCMDVCFGNGLFVSVGGTNSSTANTGATTWINPYSTSNYIYLSGPTNQFVRVK